VLFRASKDANQADEIAGQVKWHSHHLPGKRLDCAGEITAEFSANVARHLQQMEHCFPHEVAEYLLPCHTDPPAALFTSRLGYPPAEIQDAVGRLPAAGLAHQRAIHLSEEVVRDLAAIP